MTDTKHFSCGDDVLLLRAASAATPWQAARVMDAWDALAQRLGVFPCFPRDKDARAIRTRFHLLLKKHRADKLASMRTTGDSDELIHRERLLREVNAKLHAFELSKRGGRKDNEDGEPSGEENPEHQNHGHASKTTSVKKRRRLDEDSGDGEPSRKMVALLERVLDQQQQQITMQREQIEQQIAMQQQQMQMLMDLVERIAQR